jgi:ribosomal protein S18 acetylase RimI-like enzyme
MAVITNIANPAGGKLRPFDVRRDLSSVADLVELCFADTLDGDGQRYIKGMRDAARSPGFLSWAGAVVEHTSLPLSGYVWEEDRSLVGNLSLIPFLLHGKRCYLIANVAVHPDYRRRGIARALTAHALQHARSRRAHAAWLHVRADNDPAIRLYLSLGFQERARRTTWNSRSPGQAPLPAPFLSPTYPVEFRAGGAGSWPQARAWLKEAYPPEVAWHLPLSWTALQPTLWGGLHRLFSGIQVQHWVAQGRGGPLAVLACQKMYSHTDSFWLAAPKEADGAVITTLLRAARQDLSPRRPLVLDYPAGQFVQDIRAAEFEIHHTLIWMEAPY